MRSNSRKHSPSETPQALLRPPSELNRVLAAMVAMAARIGKPFSEQRMDQMVTDLAPYPVEAIEWALDSWSRNAKVLPALIDILQLLRTWIVDNTPEEKCDCRELHGRGYGWNDIKWLLEKRRTTAARWSISDWEDAFAELDAKREDGAPAWRSSLDGQAFLRAE